MTSPTHRIATVCLGFALLVAPALAKPGATLNIPGHPITLPDDYDEDTSKRSEDGHREFYSRMDVPVLFDLDYALKGQSMKQYVAYVQQFAQENNGVVDDVTVSDTPGTKPFTMIRWHADVEYKRRDYDIIPYTRHTIVMIFQSKKGPVALSAWNTHDGKLSDVSRAMQLALE